MMTNNDARERWLRVVPQRMQAALKRLEMLKHCAGPGYSATALEEQHVLNTLRDAIDSIEYKFNERRTPKQRKPRPRRTSPRFSFGDMKDLFDDGKSKGGDSRTVLEAG